MLATRFHVSLIAISLTACSQEPPEEVPDPPGPSPQEEQVIAQDWSPVSPGMDLGRFQCAEPSIQGDSTVTVVRVDPKQFELRLLSASTLGHGPLTADEWRRRYKLIAVTNAGMFDTDFVSHVGYMKNGDDVNQSEVHSDYSSVAAFRPKESNLPAFRILDTDETDFQSEILPNYDAVIQNLRLIKRPGENRWAQQPKLWSEAALGEDSDGNLLLIFCRSPYSMHDLNEHLLKLPIKLVAAQHLEGGPEASLSLQHGETSLALKGSYETGFNENDDNRKFWELPNVIGIAAGKFEP